MAPRPGPGPGMSMSLDMDDAPLTPKVDTSVGAKAPFLFRPPSTGSASLASSVREASLARRKKRARESCVDSPLFKSPGLDIHTDVDMEMRSPSPLAERKYIMKGGKRGGEYQQTGGRAGFKSWHRDADSRAAEEQLDMRSGPMHAQSPGLNNGLGQAITRFAGVAGKVLLNWSTSFRGFYAGGGEGYEWKAPTSQEGEGGENALEDPWLLCGGMPPTPGGFPREDYIPEYMSVDHMQPAAKRMRRDSTTDTTASRPVLRQISPARNAKRPHASLSPRRVPPSPGSSKRTRRQQRLSTSSRPPIPSFANSPAGGASYASPRSPGGHHRLSASKQDSPMQRHLTKIRKKEAEDEANLRRMNQQLKAMIREGKEALGTKFEIEETEDQENIADDVFVDGHQYGDDDW